MGNVCAITVIIGGELSWRSNTSKMGMVILLVILVGFGDEGTISLLSNKVCSWSDICGLFFVLISLGYLLDVLMIVRQSDRMANQLIT